MDILFCDRAAILACENRLIHIRQAILSSFQPVFICYKSIFYCSCYVSVGENAAICHARKPLNFLWISCYQAGIVRTVSLSSNRLDNTLLKAHLHTGNARKLNCNASAKHLEFALVLDPTLY